MKSRIDKENQHAGYTTMQMPLYLPFENGPIPYEYDFPFARNIF
jgi:hypothetical protein